MSQNNRCLAGCRKIQDCFLKTTEYSGTELLASTIQDYPLPVKIFTSVDRRTHNKFNKPSKNCYHRRVIVRHEIGTHTQSIDSTWYR